jgi:arsenate reductase
MLSNTFAGIAPSSVPMFIVMQLVGAGVAAGVVHALYPTLTDAAAQVVVPHPVTADLKET